MTTAVSDLVLIRSCRLCGTDDLVEILAYGEMPLANSLLDVPEPEGEDRFPLTLVYCRECSALQTRETVSAERLFREYVYFSSFSAAFVEEAQRLAERLVRERRLDGSALVGEIASNDGYLLQHYVAAGVPVLGIEPARNVAQVAIDKGVATVAEFFGAALAEDLVRTHGHFDVLHANNVLAHVSDINDFVRGMKRVLAEDGRIVVEVPYVRHMVERIEFDTVYHEHVFYYSLHALTRLFEQNGLAITDVEATPFHGGTIRVQVVHQGSVAASASVREMIEEERRLGMHLAGYYERFGAAAREVAGEIRALLGRLRSEGHSIAAYGASAKGSTLLNFAGIGRETLDFVADRSTVKQSRFMPGNALPIVSDAVLAERRPDYALLLVWNFAEEVMEQQRDYLARGGRFIVPIPRPKIVGEGE